MNALSRPQTKQSFSHCVTLTSFLPMDVTSRGLMSPVSMVPILEGHTLNHKTSIRQMRLSLGAVLPCRGLETASSLVRRAEGVFYKPPRRDGIEASFE